MVTKDCISWLKTASFEELIPIAGYKRAQDFVSYRREHGELKNWDDLKNMPNYSEEFVNTLKKSGVCSF